MHYDEARFNALNDFLLIDLTVACVFDRNKIQSIMKTRRYTSYFKISVKNITYAY